ncbi:MAG TPA: PAS domain S-box protein [Anaerolineae bacterium]
MNLNRLKWLTVFFVIAFSAIFEYVRHFVWPGLLHTFPIYLASLVVVFAVIVLFNQIVFRVLDRMQHDLAQQTGYINLLIESSGSAIITLDKAGRVQSWNHAAETIYGWSPDEAIGRAIPMVPENLRDEAMLWMDRMWKGETMRNLATQRLRKDGEVIPVLVTASPIRDADGRVVGILGISSDTRELHRLEQELLAQQRSMAALQEREHLARALHDDLGQIMGYVNTQSQAIRQLLANGQSAQADSLLQRLIAVAQDAHADVREYILSLRTNVSDEQRFLPTLRGYVQRFGQNNSILTDVKLPENLETLNLSPRVETQLMQIVKEALTNVRKHASARRVNIQIMADTESVSIVIADDGKGYDTSQAVTDDGRHFGQQMMSDRAREIGASLEVQSTPGKGTQTTIRVPRQPQVGAQLA